LILEFKNIPCHTLQLKYKEGIQKYEYGMSSFSLRFHCTIASLEPWAGSWSYEMKPVHSLPLSLLFPFLPSSKNPGLGQDKAISVKANPSSKLPLYYLPEGSVLFCITTPTATVLRAPSLSSPFISSSRIRIRLCQINSNPFFP
jgi:hypothetical protein